MRDTIENISLLQKQLNDLQLENQVLKNLLDQSGIERKTNRFILKTETLSNFMTRFGDSWRQRLNWSRLLSYWTLCHKKDG